MCTAGMLGQVVIIAYELTGAWTAVVYYTIISQTPIVLKHVTKWGFVCESPLHAIRSTVGNKSE
jgi:hypothetical protein